MSLPKPEGGLVICYSYLWRSESGAGQTEGVKDRPCAVIFVVRRENGEDVVTVAPITHTAPVDPTVAVEIPPAIKRHLGLNTERSWIVLDDFNEFIWPGYDLRFVPQKDNRYDYGFLPPNFYNAVIRRIFELQRENRVFIPSLRE